MSNCHCNLHLARLAAVSSFTSYSKIVLFGKLSFKQEANPWRQSDWLTQRRKAAFAPPVSTLFSDTALQV